MRKSKKAPHTWQRKDHYLKLIESDWYLGIVELENEISYATYDFYKGKNIKTLYLPITTSSISSPMGLGSDSKPVMVDMFGVDTYLADSMQFMLEYGCRLNKEGCFYIMPSFRGESADDRHLCQFFHSEVEIPGTMRDIMDLAEEYIRYLSKRLLDNCSDIILEFAGTTEHIEKLIKMESIPEIKYFDAIELLNNEYIDCVNVDENGYSLINSKGEKALIERFGGFVWITEMDKMIVPFYQAFDGYDNRVAKCADLLFGIGEVIGSGERHVNGEEIKNSLDIHQVGTSEYEWYIGLKDKYPIQTSGFGMGIERFLLWVLHHDDIRDCQILVRQNGESVIP